MWRDKGIGGHALCLFLAIALMGFAPPPVSAQAIRGVVVDDVSLTTVPSALVRLVRDGEAGRGILTGDDGGFFLPVPEAGAYRLEVSGMGYETALSQVVYVDRADTLSVEFRVRPNAVILQPITVVGRTRRGRSAFEQRRAEWDRGIFLTPAMVDSISPVYPAELLKGLDKVDVRWGWGVSSSGMPGPMPTVRTVMGRGCVLYMVDFVPVQPEPWVSGAWAGSQLSSLDGGDIVAVEVYRSVMEVPPELRQYTNQFRPVWSSGSSGVRYQESIHCGLTVFWTRAGW